MPFKAGQSGNPAGRPKGSRHKLEAHFIDALYADWQEHGVAALKELRLSDVSAYVRTVAHLLPKETTVDVTHRVAETISEEHARLAAEGYLESLRSRKDSSAQELGGLHSDDAPRLSGGVTASQDRSGT